MNKLSELKEDWIEAKMHYEEVHALEAPARILNAAKQQMIEAWDAYELEKESCGTPLKM